jgi:hypothetical protein
MRKPSSIEKDRLAFEASIRANAVFYRVHLFLGRGQYDRAEATTLAEIIDIGERMKQAHPGCQAKPMFYAIEASGHSTVITPEHFHEERNMIRITTNPTLTNTRTAEEQAEAKRTAKAAAERARRNKVKAAKSAAPVGPGEDERAEQVREIVDAAVDEARERFDAASPLAPGDDAAEAVDDVRAEIAATERPNSEADFDRFYLGADSDVAPAPEQSESEPESAPVAEDQVAETPAPAATESTDATAMTIEKAKAVDVTGTTQGLRKTRIAALKAALDMYGPNAKEGIDFAVKKTTRGEWHWGPVRQARQAPRKAAKADPALKARKAAALSASPSAKHAAARIAAERGEIPAAPDFSADTHKSWRKALDQIVALVKTSDIAGLEANTIQPASSSRVALCRYRDLAIIALKARACAKRAA